MTKTLATIVSRSIHCTFILLVGLISCQESPVTVEIPPGEEQVLPVVFLEFDSYAKDGRVELHWDSTPVIDWQRPLYVVDWVRIRAAKGPDERSWVVYEGETSGRDSATIENLQNGQVYSFRIAAFDSVNTIIGETRPIMTVPGRPIVTEAEIEADQRRGLEWVSNLTWSPNGREIAFVKLETWPEIQIYRYELATGISTQLTSFEGEDYFLADLSWTSEQLIHYTYSPTRTFAFLDYRIWQLSLEDGEQTALTSGPVDFGASRLSESAIVFCRGTKGPPNNPQLYMQRLDASEPQLLSSDAAVRQYGPAVSAVRNEVVFSGRSEAGHGLFTLDLSSRSITPLTTNPYWEDIQPNWSSDGRNLFFSSNRSGHFEVWVYDSYTGAIHQVTRSQAFGHEHYSPKLDLQGRRIAYLEQRSGARATLKISWLADLVLRP